MAKTKKKAPARATARKASASRKSTQATRTAGTKKAAKAATGRGSRGAKTAKAAKSAKPAKSAKSASAGRSSGTRKTAAQTRSTTTAVDRNTRNAGTSRRVPALDRERRTIREEETVPGPPSSLNMDRTASSARSGRREYTERLRQHTSTGPAMTGGDVDADWEDAEAVGDEAPGGDNPTPDQDIVEEIGQAIGITYEDNEELKGGDEVVERDRHRWELDPASREDYNEEE